MRALRAWRGYASIELALVSLGLLAFGSMMWSLVQYERAVQSSSAAAEGGVRHAASRVPGDTCATPCQALIEQHIRDTAASYDLTVNDVTVTVTGRGQVVTVVITTPIPVFGFGFTAEAQVRHVGYLPAHTGSLN